MKHNTQFPYVVVNDEFDWGDGVQPAPPSFQTWKEALAHQVAWNRNCPGHKAKRNTLYNTIPHTGCDICNNTGVG